ncbi:MAG: CHASE2 domain-containing protein [Thermonemataceae bacterium]
MNEIVIINAKKLNRNAIAKLIEYSSEAKVIGVNFRFLKATTENQLFLKTIRTYQDKLIFPAVLIGCDATNDFVRCDSLEATFFQTSDTKMGVFNFFFPSDEAYLRGDDLISYNECTLYRNDTISHFSMRIVESYSSQTFNKCKLAQQITNIYPQQDFTVIDGEQLLENPAKYHSAFNNKIVLIGFLGEHSDRKPSESYIDEDYNTMYRKYYTVLLANHIVHLLKEYEVPIVSAEE